MEKHLTSGYLYDIIAERDCAMMREVAGKPGNFRGVSPILNRA